MERCSGAAFNSRPQRSPKRTLAPKLRRSWPRRPASNFNSQSLLKGHKLEPGLWPCFCLRLQEHSNISSHDILQNWPSLSLSGAIAYYREITKAEGGVKWLILRIRT